MPTNVHDYSKVLSWVHFGDLHITGGDEQNYQDFLTLIAHANANLAGRVGWPFVMITSPADRAFIIDPEQPEQVVRGVTEVRAKTWDALGVVSAMCCVDDGPWQPMRRIGTSAGWGCAWDSSDSADGVHQITVRVKTVDGREAFDTISVLTTQSDRYEMPQYLPGDDANAIGAYPERGILGTQLGPNKNGRKW